MSIFSKYRPLVHLLAATLLLPLVCACSSKDDIAAPMPETDTTNHYINFSIVVSSGSKGTMRATTPQGGEDGDGREVGSKDENLVNGITLMLYKTDDTKEKKGINTEDDVKIAFVKYFSVIEDKDWPADEGTSYEPSDPSKKQDEAIYVTGYQPLDDSGLDFTATYHVLVVANADLTKGNNGIKVGDPLKTIGNITGVRDRVLVDRIYTGANVSANPTDFIMSSESDQTVDFSDPANRIVRGSKTYFTCKDIRVERLAARIDFWAKGAEYKDRTSNPSYETAGYEYSVKSSNDRFVLTSVTPFNLSKGREYLFKRITDPNFDTSGNSPVIYLEDEKATTTENELNYVLDPTTYNKTGNTDDMVGTDGVMNGDYWLDYYVKNTPVTATDGTQTTIYEKAKMTASSFHNRQWGNTRREIKDENGKAWENIILCYPRENTLWKTTPLYYYATGLCIEGDYYEEGWENEDLIDGKNPKITHCVYYGFLRHQGELTDKDYYKMVEKEELETYKQSLDGVFPMNFGVVRNNIYRVSIDEITEKKKDEDPKITWRIMVKNWDVFTHKTIFM